MSRSLSFLAALALAACGEKDHVHDDTAPADDSGGDTSAEAARYAFESAFTAGSSVSYDGQVFRQLLIDDMKAYLGGLTARIDAGDVAPAPGEVAADLEFYLGFDSGAFGQVSIGVSTDPPALQEVYDEVSTDKDLWGKLAGNDPRGQHEDWSVDFVGWEAEGVTSPERLVQRWVQQIDEAAVARVSGDIPLDPSGRPVPQVFLTAEGHDLQQLLEKFLRGAVAYSQGADDYLDDDTEDHGLRSDHGQAVEGKPYTALEHAWDEGFGYFGAAVDFPAWTDEEIATVKGRDSDGDGRVDLLTEACWGHATNAAKRDLGAQVAQDWTRDAWEGFYEGRRLLADTAGAGLDEAQLAELLRHRDRALRAWEASIAASAVHYINAVLRDMDAAGTGDYSFADHAKHWGELKGFALSLQFSPHAAMTDAQQAELHALLGTAPAIDPADGEAWSAYRAALLEARALLGDAHGFDAANLGDEDGNHGW